MSPETRRELDAICNRLTAIEAQLGLGPSPSAVKPSLPAPPAPVAEPPVLIEPPPVGESRSPAPSEVNEDVPTEPDQAEWLSRALLSKRASGEREPLAVSEQPDGDAQPMPSAPERESFERAMRPADGRC